jgi:hypothetical protein
LVPALVAKSYVSGWDLASEGPVEDRADYRLTSGGRGQHLQENIGFSSILPVGNLVVSVPENGLYHFQTNASGLALLTPLALGRALVKPRFSQQESGSCAPKWGAQGGRPLLARLVPAPVESCAPPAEAIHA